MSRFFVGQRVRVNKPDSNYHGKECRIISEPYDGLIESGPRAGQIKRAAYRVDFTGAMGYRCGYTADELEPILPSGQVAVTLEQLLSVPGLESLEKILGAKA